LTDLLDVNVWVALAVESHIHHARAEQYWRNEADSKIAFTTVTCLGLTRIVSNAKIAEGRALTVPEAWTLYVRWREQPFVTFLHEPKSCQVTLASIVRTGLVSPARWTDAYLAAFAISAGVRLVTFDRDFRNFPGLNLLQLES
jgi:hypothetical protein